MLSEALGIGAVAGLLLCDEKAAGETMISQPIVAGPLAGLILGDIMTGLVIGVFLQLVWINLLPVGAVLPPNATIASVVAVSYAITATDLAGLDFKTAVSFSILTAIPVGLLGRWLDVHLSDLNGIFLRQAEAFAKAGKDYGINAIVGAGVAAAGEDRRQ